MNANARENLKGSEEEHWINTSAPNVDCMFQEKKCTNMKNHILDNWKMEWLHDTMMLFPFFIFKHFQGINHEKVLGKVANFW